MKCVPESLKGFILGAVITVLVLTQPAVAQILYGGVVGNVKDPSDAAIVGATVIITNKQTNQSREAVTNETGGFSFPTVTPGIYEIRVTKEGFRTATSEVNVTVNSVARADLGLQIGAVAESVQVRSEERRVGKEGRA